MDRYYPSPADCRIEPTYCYSPGTWHREHFQWDNTRAEQGEAEWQVTRDDYLCRQCRLRPVRSFRSGRCGPLHQCGGSRIPQRPDPVQERSPLQEP